MHYKITSYQLLKSLLAGLDDDLALPWNAYSCLLWPRGRRPDGYGILRADGKMRRAHALAYELAIGPIPNGHHVLHHCDCPPCWRPIHMFTGNDTDNMRDCIAKGRFVFPDQALVPKGERHGSVKLTDEKIRAIRSLHAEGWFQDALANKYGVAQALISGIVNRKRWKHVS